MENTIRAYVPFGVASIVPMTVLLFQPPEEGIIGVTPIFPQVLRTIDLSENPVSSRNPKVAPIRALFLQLLAK